MLCNSLSHKVAIIESLKKAKTCNCDKLLAFEWQGLFPISPFHLIFFYILNLIFELYSLICETFHFFTFMVHGIFCPRILTLTFQHVPLFLYVRLRFNLAGAISRDRNKLLCEIFLRSNYFNPINRGRNFCTDVVSSLSIPLFWCN